jgi:hypothetical protein
MRKPYVLFVSKQFTGAFKTAEQVIGQAEVINKNRCRSGEGVRPLPYVIYVTGSDGPETKLVEISDPYDYSDGD